MRVTLPIICLGALVCPPPLHAQRTVFIGTVNDSITQQPVADVVVALVELELTTRTAVDGSFQFLGVSSGTHTLTLRRLGYEPMAMRFRLNVVRGRGIDLGTVSLAPSTVELDPLVVEAELIAQNPSMIGFFERRRMGEGQFLTQEEIAQIDPRQTSDIIRRVPGFNTTEDGRISSGRGTAGLQQFAACLVKVFINGMPSTTPTLDVIQPLAIAGMEFYSGSATIPAQFRTTGDAKCGVIAIWTRHARDG